MKSLNSEANERHDVNTPAIITPDIEKPGVDRDRGKKHPPIDDPDDEPVIKEPGSAQPGVREPDVDE